MYSMYGLIVPETRDAVQAAVLREQAQTIAINESG